MSYYSWSGIKVPFWGAWGGSKGYNVCVSRTGIGRLEAASRRGKNIEITSLSNKYWNSKYVTARRVKKNDPARFLQ